MLFAPEQMLPDDIFHRVTGDLTQDDVIAQNVDHVRRPDLAQWLARAIVEAVLPRVVASLPHTMLSSCKTTLSPSSLPPIRLRRGVTPDDVVAVTPHNVFAVAPDDVVVIAPDDFAGLVDQSMLAANGS
jgi:hypothetical protein